MTGGFWAALRPCDDLQKKASAVIARLCGTEAGFVTASCSAGISVAVAGAITGSDLAAVERLPDTSGRKNEVVITASAKLVVWLNRLAPRLLDWVLARYARKQGHPAP